MLSAVNSAMVRCIFCTTIAKAMKHLKIYRAIRLIHRQGSIRKAADLLATSPSALNRSIQNFEESIGVAVFERVPSGVRLTSAGELLLDLVERHLIEFGELQRSVSNLRDGLGGVLNLAIGADICSGLPLAAIADLEAEMGAVSVSVTSGDELARLRNREVDLAVVTSPETDGSVEVIVSRSVALMVCATEDVAPGGPSVGLWDIVEGRLVVPPEGTGTRTAVSHALRRHALDEGPMTSLHAAQLAQMMTAGSRTCIFPQTVYDGAQPPVPGRRLAIDLGRVQVSVLRQVGHPISRPAQVFLRQMERRLNGLGE